MYSLWTAYVRVDSHSVQMVHSRSFATAGASKEKAGVQMLVPLADMLNHGGDAANFTLAGESTPTENVRSGPYLVSALGEHSHTMSQSNSGSLCVLCQNLMRLSTTYSALGTITAGEWESSIHPGSYSSPKSHPLSTKSNLENLLSILASNYYAGDTGSVRSRLSILIPLYPDILIITAVSRLQAWAQTLH